MTDLDPIDRRILAMLQTNARISNADVAREVGMAPSAVLERIRKLEERGILLGYHARISPRALGLSLTAFVFVRSDERSWTSSTGHVLEQFPEVLEIHHVAGEDCYLVKVKVRDTEDLARLMRERFAPLDSIRNTRTTIVLSTLKETALLPLTTSLPLPSPPTPAREPKLRRETPRPRKRKAR
jgi:Lrp/AsnC family transcriptional regulator, leucine-responsive regulatory protein